MGEWEPDAGEGHVWSSSYLCREPSGEIYRNWFHLHTALRLGLRVFGVDAISGGGEGRGTERVGAGPAALGAPRRVGFWKVTSHTLNTPPPPPPTLPFPSYLPRPFPIYPTTTPQVCGELRFRL